MECARLALRIKPNNKIHWPLRALSINTVQARAYTDIRLPRKSKQQIPINSHVQIQYSKMSSFSNADTGDKTADPYTAKNKEEPSLKEKVEDLLAFIEKTKFCLLTTQTANSDLLASRCMALAGKVIPDLSHYQRY